MSRSREGRGAGLTRKLMYKRWYQALAEITHDKHYWTFMNYGYLDPEAPVLELDAQDELRRHQVQLYRHLLEPVEVEGRDLLEVGSGRGGGAEHVARCLAPASYTGLDYSENAIDLCNSIHQRDNLRFVHGDAEMIPFADDSFDVVLSVEATHCFASNVRFLTGAHRVLRPGGRLLLTDFRDAPEADDLRADIEAAGFEIESERDITAEVVFALDADVERKKAFTEQEVPEGLRAQFATFAALENAAAELRDDGTFGFASGILSHAALNDTMSDE